MDPTEQDPQLQQARSGKLSLGELETLADAFEKAGKFREALEVKDIMLEVADARLAVTDARLAELKLVAEKTIAEIYRQGDQPSFPVFELNGSVEPSIAGHYLRGIMDPQKAMYMHEKGGCSGKEFWDRLKDIVVPTHVKINEDGNPVLIPSLFDPQLFPLKYQNEIEVHVKVDTLVKDAIACLGCIGHIDTSLEISFYGITPDIVIVCKGRKIIFVIEVKAPNRAGAPENVFENDLVGGQLFLYLMSMKQAGVNNPLGAICTFNQIRIVSLQDMNKHKFNEAFAQLTQNVATPWRSEKKNDSKEEPSPDHSRQKASEKSKHIDFDHPADSFDLTLCKGVHAFKAQLYGSKTVDTHEVFPMLMLGLKTALLEAEQQGEKDQTLTEVKPGDDLSSRQFAFATATLLFFARTPKTLKVVASHPDVHCKNFYLLGTIGAGQQGDVSLAVSTSGAPAAIKFYPFKPSREATHEERKAENIVLMKRSERKRDEELERWNRLYPDKGARAIELGGRPCLLMPYGTRIPKNERQKILSVLTDELTRFNSFNFAYETSDLRWRHVLRDMEDKIFLADLGSLDELKTPGSNSIIEKQMTYLKTKINTSDDVETSGGNPAAMGRDDNNNMEGGTKRSFSGSGSLQQKKAKKMNF